MSKFGSESINTTKHPNPAFFPAEKCLFNSTQTANTRASLKDNYSPISHQSFKKVNTSYILDSYQLAKMFQTSKYLNLNQLKKNKKPFQNV